MKCDNCGNTYANVSIYVINGIANGKNATVTLKICDCCTAHGVTDDEEKLLELTGFDKLVGNIFSEKTITAIAKYIIEYGTANTTSGAWNFYYDELARKFNVLDVDIICSANDIISALSKYDAFCWDDQIIQNDCLSVNFYTNYCPNVEDCEE